MSEETFVDRQHGRGLPGMAMKCPDCGHRWNTKEGTTEECPECHQGEQLQHCITDEEFHILNKPPVSEMERDVEIRAEPIVNSIRAAVARGWCHPETQALKMDVRLASAIGLEVAELICPLLKGQRDIIDRQAEELALAQTAGLEIQATVGADRLREIARETWPQLCGPRRHLEQIADEFDNLIEQIKKIRHYVKCDNDHLIVYGIRRPKTCYAGDCTAALHDVDVTLEYAKLEVKLKAKDKALLWIRDKSAHLSDAKKYAQLGLKGQSQTRKGPPQIGNVD